MKTATVDPLLTPEDVADLLRIPRKTVLALARRGEIASLRVGGRHVRFTPAAVKTYIDKQGAAA